MTRELPEGHTVQYEHRRWQAWDPEMGTDIVLAKGGYTVAKILSKGGFEVARGTAFCRANENFNKRLGRTISLGRALKRLEAVTRVATERIVVLREDGGDA